MDSDEEIFDTVVERDPRSSKRRRTAGIDASAFEDIARELEEDTSAAPSRGKSEDEEEDPDAWLLEQYDGPPVDEGTWTSGEGEPDGMDVDLEELLEEGGEKEKEPAAVSKTEEPVAVEEKATYTSSGRLLVPSHKSREAKAAAGAMALAWEEIEMQSKKKPSGSKSKSKPPAPKASATNSASGTPQPRPSSTIGNAPSKSAASKSKSSAGSASKSAAGALAASKSSASKSKKKGDASRRVKEKEARSRSESRQVETPAPEAGVQPKVTIVEPVEEEEDSRLYCICKTRYDEEKIMIACDRCDDWYHPSCVKLPEVDLDLIDQFVCPLCVIKHNVYTTYKTRCAVKDCNKPARAPVSKYCSDACGIKNASAKLEALRAQGVNLEQLWYAAKDAKAPEGVVYVHLPGPAPHPPPPGVNNIGPNATRLMDGRQKADQEKLSRMMESLDQFGARRAALEVDIIRLKARLRLLRCAARRVEKAGGERCGFDVRVVMNDEEWSEWLEGEGAWISKDEVEGEEQEQEAAYMSAEGMFCLGKKRCDRHTGWQNLKFVDFSGECEAKEFQLADVNIKHQDTERKIAELRSVMSSMARPPAERVELPPAVEPTTTVA